VCVLLGRVITE